MQQAGHGTEMTVVAGMPATEEYAVNTDLEMQIEHVRRRLRGLQRK